MPSCTWPITSCAIWPGVAVSSAAKAVAVQVAATATAQTKERTFFIFVHYSSRFFIQCSCITAFMNNAEHLSIPKGIIVLPPPLFSTGIFYNIFAFYASFFASISAHQQSGSAAAASKPMHRRIRCTPCVFSAQQSAPSTNTSGSTPGILMLKAACTA